MMKSESKNAMMDKLLLEIETEKKESTMGPRSPTVGNDDTKSVSIASSNGSLPSDFHNLSDTPKYANTKKKLIKK